MRRMVWPRRPHGSGVTVGVTAGVTRNVTPTEGGGCYINSRRGVTFRCFIYPPRRWGVTPVSISIPAGRLRARPRHERGRADERRDA